MRSLPSNSRFTYLHLDRARRHRHTPPRVLVIIRSNCSVFFFHHIEKTGGTTLRAVMQRHAQLALFDFISFVNRQDRLQLQVVLHRLHTLSSTPGGLVNLRLAVEIHIGADLTLPYFFKHALPDLVFIRHLLRSAGCRCNLVSLLRHPLLMHLSWHSHFAHHRVPLCFWKNPSDCQTRLSLGLTCHDAPRHRQLGGAHEAASTAMWRSFDLVGVTELFDEFVLLLADLVSRPVGACATARDACTTWCQSSPQVSHSSPQRVPAHALRATAACLSHGRLDCSTPRTACSSWHVALSRTWSASATGRPAAAPTSPPPHHPS